MNVLIVDDDRFVVAALKDSLNWDDLGFTNVFSAYNINEAMTIIENQTIDLLLSDIDMPHGSGLDLLTWIRTRYQDMLVIFLTNYANFDYAQKAVELNSFHYFLKPIEYDKLTEIIRNATLHLSKKNMQSSVQYEHFWNAFVHGKIADDQNALEKYISEMQLPYTDTDIFLPVIFDVFPYYLTEGNELKSSFSDSMAPDFIKATFQTAFAGQTCSKDAFIEYNRSLSQFLAVFHLKNSEIPPLLSMYCETFIELITKQMHCTLDCFVGLPSRLSLFQLNFHRLCDMMQNNLEHKGHIYELTEYRPVSDYYPALDTRLLEFYLENAQYSAFLEHCRQYLNKLSGSDCLHQKSIISFQVDISQMIYVFLKSKGISANELFHDDSYHILSENAKYSVHYMEMYLRYIITVIQNRLETASYKSIAKSIKDYVDKHYAEDISRDCITEIFFLDHNYGSKIFKREVGISFKNYIIQKRIEVAKDLLQNTTLPINSVANKVGYDNYSYFSRIFKKVTGMTPVEYRNNAVNSNQN